MIRITPIQLEYLENAGRLDFHQRAASYVAEVLPDIFAEYGEEAMIGYVRESEHRANRRQIESELGIVQWVCVSLVIGKEFDQYPEIIDFFSTPGMASEDKLSALVDALNQALGEP